MADALWNESVRCYTGRFYEILGGMILGMTRAELTDSLSHNFIVQMIPHHEAAIEMSRSLLQFSTCAPLRTIAEGIITEQTKSIADMRRVLDGCESLSSTPQSLRQYQTRFLHITQRMFRRMALACTDTQIDADFMRQMIPHHEGAIEMSQNLLCHPTCPALKPIVQAIITSQERGVGQMQQLLRCHTCAEYR